MRRSTAAVLATTLTLAACGGGTSTNPPASSTTSPTTTTTRDESTATVTTGAPSVPDDTLQRGNTQPTTGVVIRPSTELPRDPRMGVALYPAYPDINAFDMLLEEFVASGAQRIDLSYDDIEYPINWDHSETVIDPAFDRFVDNLNERGIAIDYLLHFWNKEGHAAGEELATPRFRTDDQIEDFEAYVRFIVERYRGRIQYYTIWSEPDACGDGGVKCIEPADYLAMVERVIPVIREADPDAKVALAPVVLFYAQDSMDTLVGSDDIDLFDVIQWHGIYNVVPGDNPVGDYYAAYPEIVADIQATAAANGFDGEYWCTEITYCAVAYDAGCPPPDPVLSDLQVAKYYARSFVLHMSMDVGTSYKTYRGTTGPITFATLGRLSTLLSGTAPADIDVDVETDAVDVETAGFVGPGGGDMVAVWTDGAASDNDPRTPASLTFTGMAGRTAVAIDVVAGTRQPLIATDRGPDLLVTDLLVTDSPVIVVIEP